MNSLPANNPDWLVKKIIKMGGTISFYDFMNFVLNDPINGYYGSGKAELAFEEILSHHHLDLIFRYYNLNVFYSVSYSLYL